MPENINLFGLGKASFPDLEAPTAFHDDHAEVAAELIRDGSIEFSSGKIDELDAVTDLLPFHTSVFVPVLPKQTMASRMPVIQALIDRGYLPVPHIAARRIPDRQTLVEFVTAAVDAGVHRVLLIGGDRDAPAGPFKDAESVLRDGLLADMGIREIGIAGYPEGHPNIPTPDLDAALERKLSLLDAQGIGAQVITQFSFLPNRIVEYCSRIASQLPDVPITVGLAGPAKLRELVHFARYCGVSASLSAVKKIGVNVAQLVDHRRADEQLGYLASFNAAHSNSNIVGVHVFSFGGFEKSARWMHGHLNAPGGLPADP
jgi:methylenetetrahydrofolate reductase (NADPH)